MAGKKDLVDVVANSLDITKVQADYVITGVIEAIQNLTVCGDRLTIRNFGSFVNKTSAPRMGRNPQTGAALEIPAKTKLTFKAAK